jgi:hypothetical protein
VKLLDVIVDRSRKEAAIAIVAAWAAFVFALLVAGDEVTNLAVTSSRRLFWLARTSIWPARR